MPKRPLRHQFKLNATLESLINQIISIMVPKSVDEEDRLVENFSLYFRNEGNEIDSNNEKITDSILKSLLPDVESNVIFHSSEKIPLKENPNKKLSTKHSNLDDNILNQIINPNLRTIKIDLINIEIEDFDNRIFDIQIKPKSKYFDLLNMIEYVYSTQNSNKMIKHCSLYEKNEIDDKFRIIESAEIPNKKFQKLFFLKNNLNGDFKQICVCCVSIPNEIKLKFNNNDNLQNVLIQSCKTFRDRKYDLRDVFVKIYQSKGKF
ncbi:hypothetical protein MHBO_003369 [Bonamia ostreae]|uniref:Uncharacterized protein n=1 Tax=Bonamia ostreae TaxID=126728 RepID=A0ABV2AR42_9EUKA